MEKCEAENEKWSEGGVAVLARVTREISYLTSLPILIESSKNNISKLK